MKPFGLYADIEPALGRSDLFVTVTKYAAEPEPYRDLLHFPRADPSIVAAVAHRIHRLKLSSGIIPPLINCGIQEERWFLAFSLGLARTAPTLLPLRAPVPSGFWAALEEGLSDLHKHGFSYGHLRQDTVAITDQGAPLLFDTTGLHSLQAQDAKVDLRALDKLRASIP